MRKRVLPGCMGVLAAALLAACGGSNHATSSGGVGAGSTSTASSTAGSGSSSGAGGGGSSVMGKQIPLTGQATSASYDDVAKLLWVVFTDFTGGNGSGVVTLDPTTNALGAPLDTTSSVLGEIAAAPALAKVYIGRNSNVDVIDATVKTVKGSLSFPSMIPSGSFAGSIVFDAQTRKVFMTAQGIASTDPAYLAILDATTDTFVSAVQLPRNGELAVDSTKGLVYLVSIDPTDNTPHVVQFDEATMMVTKDTQVTMTTGWNLSHPGVIPGQGVAFLASNATSSTLYLVDSVGTIMPPAGKMLTSVAFSPAGDLFGLVEGAPGVTVYQLDATMKQWIGGTTCTNPNVPASGKVVGGTVVPIFGAETAAAILELLGEGSPPDPLLEVCRFGLF